MKRKRDILSMGLTASLIAACGCFLASLFMNIGHPLFWNDEGMTVMHGNRVLEYGYPKVWDGKNNVYDLLHPDKQLGIDQKTGAFIGGSGWGHYYFAAPFIAIAKAIEDDHAKTAFIRFWFALAGLLGLLVLGRTIGKVWDKPRQRLAVWLIFAVSALLSVPLVLHLREARYYSLCVLLAALIAAAYYRKRLLPDAAAMDKRQGLVWYNLYLTFLMILMLFTFSPGFVALAGAITFSELMRMISLLFTREGEGRVKFSRKTLRQNLIQTFRANIFLLVSLLIFIPYLVFFRTIEINRLLEESNTRINFYSHYATNLSSILDYFFRFEPFVLFIVLRLFVLILTPWLILRGDKQINRQLRLSAFLSFCFLFTLLLGARVPNEIFIRYFIPAIPLCFALIALDVMVIWNWLCPRKKIWQLSFALSCLGLWGMRLPHNLPYLQGHLYEMNHPYKGHLDYMIPFIRMRFSDPSEIVIAANYEETSFMYYLDAKVTVGYVQANVENDIRYPPDVIYFNPQWAWGQDPRILQHFIDNGKYGRAVFPVCRYRVNNIPEVNFKPEITHQFRTLVPEGKDAVAELLVKIE